MRILSWASKLLETYDICESEVGNVSENEMLLPMSHLTAKAQIEILISETGSFISANTVVDEESVTVIPVTEDSASRSSGVTPHPLHDKLIYIAKDYATYTEKDNKAQWNAHQELLKLWVDSPYTCMDVQAIYAYLEKGSVLHDLICAGILILDGTLLDKKTKLQKTLQTEAFVRIRILKDPPHIEPWRNKELFELYHKFYMSLHLDQDLCYVTGRRMYCTDKHPAKLRVGKDKAKLISANDSDGFTYRGRFASKKDAISIGYETSQKIHNALRWLIQKQAYKYDGQTILTWNAHCDKILSSMDSVLTSFEEKPRVSTEYEYAAIVNRAIKGYVGNITTNDNCIVIMALEAATVGRFSITYYQEINVSSYYANLTEWYTHCNWPQYSTREFMGDVGTPIPKDIVSCAYGTLKGAFFDVNEKLMTLHLGRILPCIAKGQKIPEDFIVRLNNQVKVMSTVDKYQWQRAIGILCAVFKKYCHDTRREEWSDNIMNNQKVSKGNIAYQLGRLLAMYDGIEQYALNILNEKRPTNAMRLYAPFQEHPARTLSVLDKKLNPYINKLGKKCTYLLEMKQDISEELAESLPDQATFINLQNLDAYFVLGFDCQRNAIKKENKDRKEKQKLKQEENKQQKEEQIL